MQKKKNRNFPSLAKAERGSSYSDSLRRGSDSCNRRSEENSSKKEEKTIICKRNAKERGKTKISARERLKI